MIYGVYILRSLLYTFTHGLRSLLRLVAGCYTRLFHTRCYVLYTPRGSTVYAFTLVLLILPFVYVTGSADLDYVLPVSYTRFTFWLPHLPRLPRSAVTFTGFTTHVLYPVYFGWILRFWLLPFPVGSYYVYVYAFYRYHAHTTRSRYHVCRCGCGCRICSSVLAVHCSSPAFAPRTPLLPYHVVAVPLHAVRGWFGYLPLLHIRSSLLFYTRPAFSSGFCAHRVCVRTLRYTARLYCATFHRLLFATTVVRSPLPTHVHYRLPAFCTHIHRSVGLPYCGLQFCHYAATLLLRFCVCLPFGYVYRLRILVTRCGCLVRLLPVALLPTVPPHGWLHYSYYARAIFVPHFAVVVHLRGWFVRCGYACRLRFLVLPRTRGCLPRTGSVLCHAFFNIPFPVLYGSHYRHHRPAVGSLTDLLPTATARTHALLRTVIPLRSTPFTGFCRSPTHFADCYVPGYALPLPVHVLPHLFTFVCAPFTRRSLHCVTVTFITVYVYSLRLRLDCRFRSYLLLLRFWFGCRYARLHGCCCPRTFGYATVTTVVTGLFTFTHAFTRCGCYVCGSPVRSIPYRYCSGYFDLPFRLFCRTTYQHSSLDSAVLPRPYGWLLPLVALRTHIYRYTVFTHRTRLPAVVPRLYGCRLHHRTATTGCSYHHVYTLPRLHSPALHTTPLPTVCGCILTPHVHCHHYRLLYHSRSFTAHSTLLVRLHTHTWFTRGYTVHCSGLLLLPALVVRYLLDCVRLVHCWLRGCGSAFAPPAARVRCRLRLRFTAVATLLHTSYGYVHGSRIPLHCSRLYHTALRTVTRVFFGLHHCIYGSAPLSTFGYGFFCGYALHTAHTRLVWFLVRSPVRTLLHTRAVQLVY